MKTGELNQFRARGWSVRTSILMELDVALSILMGGVISSETEEFSSLVQSVKPEQLQELENLLGRSTSAFRPVLEPLAWLAGVLFEEDYATATRVVGQLSVQKAYVHLTGEKDNSQVSMEQLTEKLFQIQMEVTRENRIELMPDSIRRDRGELSASLSFLRGESRAMDFWRWLDRFYYENYQPWRASRKPLMDMNRQMALGYLEAAEGEGIPFLDWLSEKNPVRRIPGLRDAVESGNRHVCFWIEPFCLTDTWSAYPGLVVVSFAPPGAIFAEFSDYARRLSSALQALSDPTRLIILRLIRNMGMNNTDMAEYLDLARPTVSIHARILREAGLIHTFADGRSARHEIDTQAIRKLFADLERFLDLP